ncbi:Glutathione S-transferase [Paraburkholderia caribensis MBA4]|uniref:Glutathione S-transferase n=1 Tax=Paraburkholderia caribensis MBA4 TaxID=1323664 RepID=A0A0P0RI73_9BURK|nr:glutathione S-transferase N-terminal domain-containing protein [Paraburkholderia caribensis]ALL68425.1 Glutathione S-transferase [Paraburkholderia caribensis MBA4]
MLRLFYSPEACSLAAHIALEETGAPFDHYRVALGEGEQDRPEYRAINPKGRVPAIVDGDLVVTECPAVLLYIARRFPEANLWPGDLAGETRCAEWLAWCASGLHESFAHVRRPDRFADSDLARRDVVAKGRATTRHLWEMVEDRISNSDGEWAAGEQYSVADASLFTFWIWGRAKTLQYDMRGDFPAWTAHSERMAKRIAVQRALAREGIPLP